MNEVKTLAILGAGFVLIGIIGTIISVVFMVLGHPDASMGVIFSGTLILGGGIFLVKMEKLVEEKK